MTSSDNGAGRPSDELRREGRHVTYMLDMHDRGPSEQLPDELGDVLGHGLGDNSPPLGLLNLELPLDGGGAAPPVATGAPRKQKSQAKAAVAVRKWILIDAQGDSMLLPMGKMAITQQMGVQLRDLRLLDPKLATSYPSAILCRERALVVNLEYIKMVVTVDRAYVAVTEDENVGSFVDTLQRKLAAHAAAVATGGEGGIGLVGGGGLTGGPATKSMVDLAAAAGVTAGAGGIADEMPFELRVLEVALDSVCSFLKRMAGDLEAAAHPALDALTTTVSTTNLERVRRIKNRMVRLTTRVETLREVLEKFLDDDSDMRDMNLTALEAERQQEAARAQLASLHRAGAGGGETPMAALDVPLTLGGGYGEVSGIHTPASPKSLLTYSSSDSEEEEEAIEQVEMLLEAYFMQVDNTWNQLRSLCEYVDDTEDFINIELDSHRNQLIRLDLVLTAFSAALALITAVTGLFAMNVQLRPDASGPGPYSMFVALSVAAGMGAIAVFGGILAYCRYKRLI